MSNIYIGGIAAWVAEDHRVAAETGGICPVHGGKWGIDSLPKGRYCLACDAGQDPKYSENGLDNDLREEHNDDEQD